MSGLEIGKDIGEGGIILISEIGDRDRGKDIGEGEGVSGISIDWDRVSEERGFNRGGGERVEWSLTGLGLGGTQGCAHSDFLPHDEAEDVEALVMES